MTHQSSNRRRVPARNDYTMDIVSKFWRRYSTAAQTRFAKRTLTRQERRERRLDIERELDDDFPADDFWEDRYRDYDND